MNEIIYNYLLPSGCLSLLSQVTCPPVVIQPFVKVQLPRTLCLVSLWGFVGSNVSTQVYSYGVFLITNSTSNIRHLWTVNRTELGPIKKTVGN